MTFTETTPALPRTKPQIKNRDTRAKPDKPIDRPVTKAKSKQEKVLNLLSAPTGTTLKVMVKATGWQQHSVRGFLAGVVRKKLKLNLISTVKGDERVYRIGKKATSKSAPAKAGA